jgi:hypothetical protein
VRVKFPTQSGDEVYRKYSRGCVCFFGSQRFRRGLLSMARICIASKPVCDHLSKE